MPTVSLQKAFFFFCAWQNGSPPFSRVQISIEFASIKLLTRPRAERKTRPLRSHFLWWCKIKFLKRLDVYNELEEEVGKKHLIFGTEMCTIHVPTTLSVCSFLQRFDKTIRNYHVQIWCPARCEFHLKIPCATERERERGMMTWGWWRIASGGPVRTRSDRNKKIKTEMFDQLQKRTAAANDFSFSKLCWNWAGCKQKVYNSCPVWFLCPE